MVMPKAYEGNEPYIFISYAHKDSEKVLPIIQALQDRGFRVWYDAGIEAGTEWPEYIAEHLDGCACFLAFISQSALDSHNCRREINFAIELRKDPLAVYLEDVKLSLGMRMQLGTLQAMFYNRHNGMDSFMDALAVCELLKPCKGELPAPAPKPTPKPAPAPQPAPKKPAPKPAPTPKNPTPAEYYQWGKQLYDKKNYADAVSFFRDAAQQGHADSQFQLGWCFFCGNGVTQNMKTATEWYRKAADQGHTKAQCELAYCYSKGHGVPYSLEETAKWYRKAAERGHAKAQYELAGCYRSGYGVAMDLDAAVMWYQKAAQQKYQDAQAQLDACTEKLKLLRATPEDCLKLGNQYLSNKEYAEAAEMFRRGAEQGNAECQYHLGNCYLNGWGLAKSLDEAVKCYKKAAELGHIDAQNKLADFYTQGTGVQKSYPEAIKWYKKAANQNSAQAQYRLAWIYFYGNGGAKDLESAIYWARKAAAQKYEESEIMVEKWSASLAIQQMSPEQCFEKAEALFAGKQLVEAFKWYKIAGEKGHMEAAFRTAEFMDGLTDDNGDTVVSQFIHEAEKWYDKAAALGHPFAKKFAISCCHEGAFPKRSAEEWYQAAKKERGDQAEECYRKAARAGHLEAQRRLSMLFDQDYRMPRYNYTEEVVYWWRRAAAQGDLEAMCKAGYHDYTNGNYDDALAWFRKADNANFPLGTHYLACCYSEGKGVPQDVDHALDLFIDVLENHFSDISSHSFIGDFSKAFAACWVSAIAQSKKYTEEYLCAWLTGFLKGFTPGEHTVFVEAEDLLQLADSFDKNWIFTPSLIICRYIASTKPGKKQDYMLSAMTRIAKHYIYGHGVKKDFSEAAKWLHAAADLDAYSVDMVWYRLIVLYKNGWGVNKSWLTAQTWRSRFITTKYWKFDKDVLENIEDELRSAYTFLLL